MINSLYFFYLFVLHPASCFIDLLFIDFAQHLNAIGDEPV